MITLILSLTAATLQILFLVKYGGKHIQNRRKRKLMNRISKFKDDNYVNLVEEISNNNGPDVSTKLAIEFLDMYRDISNTYFEGCTHGELKIEFQKMQVEYSNHLPELKMKMRTTSIDKILED